MSTPSDRPGPGVPPRRQPGALPPHLDPRGPRRPVPRVDQGRVPAPPPTNRPLGRPPGGPPPRKRWGRVLSWVALTMSVVILGLAGVGYVLIQHYDGQIDRIPGLGDRGPKPDAAPKNAQNVLLVGSDSREGANAKGTGGRGFSPGQRSDTIILAHLYGKSDKALFVSFPRDSYVEIPSYTDAAGRTHRSHHGRINSAFSLGGPKLLIATVEKLTDIRVDHYIQVDFVGFKSMVDRLGGVDICLPKDVNDPKSQLVLSAGRHHVNGKTALAFARARKSFAGQDLDRIKHQQQLIGSLIHKVLSAGTLINPLKLNGFLNAATGSLQVDEDLSFNKLKDIALRARGFSSGGVLFTTAPIANPSARINGASVVELDEEAGADLFGSLRRDQAPGTADKPSPNNLVVKPGSISVRVFNGSGVSGLARRAFNDLASVGFVTTGTPTNRGSGSEKTTVFYGPNKADSARTLQAALPGSVLQEDPNLQRTLEVVVGSSYDGAKKVTVTGTPKPTKSATPALRTAEDDVCA